MADKITYISKCEVHWDISYEVEYENKKNSFCVTIPKSGMVTPTDIDEAKSKANIKAKLLKDAWIASLETLPITVSVSTEPENVTL